MHHKLIYSCTFQSEGGLGLWLSVSASFQSGSRVVLLWLYKIWHEWHFMCLGFFYFLYICRCEGPLGAGQKSFYLSFIRSLSFMWQHVILVVVFQLLLLLWLHLSFPFVLLLFHLHFCFALDFVRGFIWIFWSSSIFTIHHSTEGRHENWTIGLYLRFFGGCTTSVV